MFLQTPTQVIATTNEKKIFSLWEILFSGGLIGNIIMIAIFLLGILALYIFLERFFYIKRASKETPNFLENIKDFCTRRQDTNCCWLLQNNWFTWSKNDWERLGENWQTNFWYFECDAKPRSTGNFEIWKKP